MTHGPSGTAPQSSLSSRAVGALLRSPLGRRLGRSLVMLRVRGRHSGTIFEFPVQFASTPGGIAIVPGRPQSKQWWRNLREPSPIEVLHEGAWHRGRGIALVDTDSLYERTLDDYHCRWPDIHVEPDGPIVLITWIDES